MSDTPRPPVGAHLSIAGGVWRALERARDLECEALQVFTQAPGRWAGPALTDEAAGRFCELAAELGIGGRCFAHAPYLLNLAAADPALRARSVTGLVDQLEKAARLGLEGVVLHPGAPVHDSREIGLQRVVEGAREALDRADGTRLLLEGTAGQGSTLGVTWDEIGYLLERLPRERTGVCWDTAHLWAAGWDLHDEDAWERLWADFRRATGRTAPDLFHLNDTNVPLGARRDRHARIGHGLLGEAVFTRVLNDERLRDVPMVIETPKGKDEVTWDREALALLKAWRLGGHAPLR